MNHAPFSFTKEFNLYFDLDLDRVVFRDGRIIPYMYLKYLQSLFRSRYSKKK